MVPVRPTDNFLCILMLFMMNGMLFIALLVSLFAKNSLNFLKISLFLLMANVIYIVCLRHLYSGNNRIIKNFSLFYYIF